MQAGTTTRALTLMTLAVLGAPTVAHAEGDAATHVDLSAFAVNLPATGLNVGLTLGRMGQQVTDDPGTEPAPRGEVGDREVGATVAVVTGGDNTVGGLRVSGRFLYQLSEQDWFDGAASFTYGGDEAGCMTTAGGMQLPQPASVAEGRDAALGADAGAGEHDDLGVRGEFQRWHAFV